VTRTPVQPDAMDPLEDHVADACTHPRPRLRRAFASLDGVWDLHDADGPQGGPPTAYARTIVVPYAPESPASGVGDLGHHPLLWYRRELTVPVSWQGRRVLLHVSGIEGRVDVWCEGRLVAAFARGLLPAPVDLTRALAGRSTAVLEVRIERDPLDLGSPRGKQDWEPLPHSIWYPRSSGITRTVWIEPAPEQRVTSIDATSDLGAFALDLRARIEGVPHATPAAAGWRLEVRARVGTTLLAEESWTVTGPELRRRLALPDPGIDDARDRLLWRPERPTVIDLDVRLTRGDRVVDHVRSYTALRTVGVDGDAFTLNGRPYPLRLVLDQGYWPSTHRTPPDGEALRLDVERARSLGFNGVRKHQTIEDERYYAWADHLGLLVWSELPSAYAFSADALDALTDTWRRLIERDAGYPCVSTWVAFNESWGVPDLPTRSDQRHAVRALYHLAKALDPSRPVVGNDGWEYVVGDMLTVHDYAVDAAQLRARYLDRNALEHALDTVRPGGRRLRLDEGAHTPAAHTPAARTSRPVVLSEFGGVRCGDTPDGWGYAQVDDAEALVERYTALLRAVHASDVLAGFCYTQLTDTFQEQNGLLTMDRRPKADIAVLARATRGEGAPTPDP
jgi:beta-galactosidase/beta-glucuronidase